MDSKMKKNLLLMVVVWVWAIALPTSQETNVDGCAKRLLLSTAWILYVFGG